MTESALYGVPLSKCDGLILGSFVRHAPAMCPRYWPVTRVYDAFREAVRELERRGFRRETIIRVYLGDASHLMP